MTFFDKLFNIRNRSSKIQCGNTKTSENFCFSSSHLDISKDQIRVVLFRECDRRGRKLLFDSYSVEKLPLLQATGYACRQGSISNYKIFDFVEVTNTHGYKYKKPCHDVSVLGEMIFGSVAMVYKGSNTCKVHSIPSPKSVMFTTVMYVPNRCYNQTFSERSSYGYCTGSSSGSLDDNSGQNQSSSSDSRLYKHAQIVNAGISTYPFLKNNSNPCHINNFFGIESQDSKWRCSFLRKSRKADCLEKMCSDNSNNELCVDNLSRQDIKVGCDNIIKTNESDQFLRESPTHSFCDSKNDFDYKIPDRQGSYGSSSMLLFGSGDSKVGSSSQLSSLSGSLGSLRRRWMQSYATSIDASFSSGDSSFFKPRTKLGIGLVIDLRDTLLDETENFLFNHTILIDSIMNKLQSSVEMAYVRKENFVDLTYTAFLECQQSMVELITSSMLEKTLWLTLYEQPAEEATESPEIYSQFHESIKSCKKQGALNESKQKFVNTFADVLSKFDTKDTNFFISTLLTAVLTNHLSWVTGISVSQQSTVENFKPYNPLWAQLNDLSGILGSPLRSTKTVVTGSSSHKCHMTAIIQILTYFVRCYSVIENVYDVNIDEIINVENCDLQQNEFVDDFENFDSGVDCHYNMANNSTNIEKQNNKKCETVNFTKKNNEINEKKSLLNEDICVKSWTDNVEDYRRVSENNLQRSCASDGLKRSKSTLSCFKDLKIDDIFKKENLYPNIQPLAEMESVSLSDLNESSQERTFLVETQTTEKIKKLIRVPSSAVQYHVQQNLSPDEGYDTVDSSNVNEIFSSKELSCLSRKSAENVVFVLGENEDLVNVPKKVVMTKSFTVDMEKENSKFVLCDRKLSLCRSKSMNIPHSFRDKINDKRCRTLGNACSVRDYDLRTLWQNNENSENLQDSENRIIEKVDPTPWIQCEIPMPRSKKSTCFRRKLNASSVLGSVTDHYNSEKIIQGVIQDKKEWNKTLINDLMLSAHCPVLERELSEALCIVADMETWEVSLCSSHASAVDRNRYSGVRVGMSQLVADMLESFMHLHKIKLSSDYCLNYIERKLHEIYEKSKTVAELLDSTEFCSMDYLTTRLEVTVNDVPLLFSIASTHSPHITSKYGLSFT